MNVFIPWLSHEDIAGVYLTLEEALSAGNYRCPVDEYTIGQADRIRAYDSTGKLWWENGKFVDAYFELMGKR